MSRKADAVRAMDHHWRYHDLPIAFKRWWALTDLKKRKARRPCNRTARDRSRILNKMLLRAGRPDLLITFNSADVALRLHHMEQS